jgi:hypothetical protein
MWSSVIWVATKFMSAVAAWDIGIFMLLTYDQFCMMSDKLPFGFLMFCNVFFFIRYLLRISGFRITAAVSFIIPRRCLAMTDRTTHQEPVPSCTEKNYCACVFMCGICVQIHYSLAHSHTRHLINCAGWGKCGGWVMLRGGETNLPVLF